MTDASVGFNGFFGRRAGERNAAARPAFGGPVNLVRLFLMRRESMPVVCIDCRTLNSKTQKTCIGCAGKLPAYFAGGAEAPTGAASKGTTMQRLAACWPAIAPRWRLVAGAAALLVLSAVAFQAWFIAHAAAVRSRPMVSAVAQRAAPPRPTFDVPVALPTLQTASIEPARVEALPVQPVIVSPLPPHQPSSQRSLAGEPAMQRVSADGSAGLRGAAPESDPLAGCRSMWLFARAACLNDRCAQAPLKRHPQCQQVVAQRRLDEARRDGLLLN